VEIFGILFRIVLRSTPPVFSFRPTLFFQLHQKCPDFTRLMTEGSSVKGVSQRQHDNECKSRSALTISVRLNHAQRENNRSSFGTFSGPNLMLKLTSHHGLDGRNSRAGFGPRAGLCRPLAMGVFRGGAAGAAAPPNRPQKLSFYHDEGSTGGTSLAAMPSVLDTKARRLNFIQ